MTWKSERRRESLSDTKLGIAAAARTLGLSPHTLRAWVRARRIPFYRCGRRILFSRADLECMLAASRIEAREGG